MEDEINWHCLVLVIAGTIINFVIWYGGKISVILVCIAVMISYRDPTRDPKNFGGKHITMWLTLAILQYATAVWISFNGWVGSYYGILAGLILLGNAIYLTISRKITLGARIISLIFIASILMHFFYVINEILHDPYLYKRLILTLRGVI